MMLSPSVKTTYLLIFQFSGNMRKTNQNNLKISLELTLGQPASFGEECQFQESYNLCLTIGLMVLNCKTHHIYALLVVQETLSLDFLELSQDCSGLYSVKCHVWETVKLSNYESKGHWPIRLPDFSCCSFCLTFWLFGQIIIDIPRVLEVFLVVLEIKKETLLLVIVYCITVPLCTFIDDFFY